MDPLILLVSVMTAAAVFLLFVGMRSLLFADQTQIAQRLAAAGQPRRSGLAAAPQVTWQARPLNVLTSLDAPLRRFSWGEKAALDLRKADLNLHVSEFIAIRAGLSLLVFMLGVLLLGSMLGYLVGAGGGLGSWLFCGIYVKGKINRRRKALEDQLDAALMSIATSLRSGLGFLQACRLTAGQMTWPLKNEIEETLDEVSLGASIDDAIKNLAERVQSYEMDIAATAVLVQRSVGGDLAEVLDNTSKTIRDRRELRGQIMALTAQQRLSAVFVALIPPGLAALLAITSYQFMRPLFETTLGNILIGLSAVLDIVGFLVIKRLTRIDF